jgi:hypothetical protein
MLAKHDTSRFRDLPGRMSGYWKQEILNGHKTGPYRTSIDALYLNTKNFTKSAGGGKY